jgi:hypothetical protein
LNSDLNIQSLECCNLNTNNNNNSKIQKRRKEKKKEDEAEDEDEDGEKKYIHNFEGALSLTFIHILAIELDAC